MKTNGIVLLSAPEIHQVSGGKSVVNNFWDSVCRWIDGSGGPPRPFSGTIREQDLAQLEFMIVDSGGSVSSSGSLANGTVDIRLTGSDGSFTFMNVTVIR
jgi:hypothetical protein